MIKYLPSVSILLPLLLAFSENGNAQQMMGLASSNYAANNGIYTNPAFIADSRHRFSFHLATANVNVSNNYVHYKGPESLYQMFKEGRDLESDYLEVVKNDRPKMFTSLLEFRGPSVMVAVTNKHSFAITTRVRGSIHANNVSADAAHLLMATKNRDQLLDKVKDNNEFSLNANVNAEVGVTYAQVVLDEEKHFAKAGITVKKVMGMYSGYFINQGMNFKVTERTYPTNPPVNYSVVEIERMQAGFGYNNGDYINNVTPEKLFGWFTDGNAPGNGWGADIGFVYEFRPDIAKYRYEIDGKDRINHRQNKYKFRLGAALLDVGSVRYKNPEFTRSYKADITNRELNLDNFENAETADDYSNVVINALGANAFDYSTSFSSGLPTALNLNFDYRIWKKLYLNAMVLHNLRGKYAVAMRYNSSFSVTPRFETGMLEVALPLSLYNNYSTPGAGAMVRVGGFFVGSDNIGGLFNIGQPYGANLYLGLSVINITRGRNPVKLKRKAERRQMKATKAAAKPKK